MSTVQRGVDRPSGPDIDTLLREEPLEIRVDGQAVAVTMRTPGHDLDLAAGFLHTEGVIDDLDDLTALAQLADNVVDCRLASGVQPRLSGAVRAQFSHSSCGLCGKQSLERVAVTAHTPIRAQAVTDDQIRAIPALLRHHMPWFAATGGCHGAALLSPTLEVRVAREDVGRHNAVDKVVGAQLRADAPLGILAISSRAGFEIVQKARVAGIGAVVALGAASDLAARLAAQEGMTLVGFARGDRFTRYR